MGTSPENSVVDRDHRSLGGAQSPHRRWSVCPHTGQREPGADHHGARLARLAEVSLRRERRAELEPASRKRARTPGGAVVTGRLPAGVGRAVAHAFARRGARSGSSPATGRRPRRGVCGMRGSSWSTHWCCPPTSPTPGRSSTPRRRRGASSGRSTSGSTTRWRRCSPPLSRPRRRSSSGATEVTYLGTVFGTMAALRRMVPRDRGTVVQVGSALAYRAIPLQSAYCGAKFAIRGMTDRRSHRAAPPRGAGSGSRWCSCPR